MLQGLANKSGLAVAQSLQKTTVGAQLAANFKRSVLRNETIIQAALSEVLTPLHGDVEAMRLAASKIVIDTEKAAYARYLSAEKESLAAAINTVFGAMAKHIVDPLMVLDLIAANAKGLDEFFMSVAQGRKSRAGRAVETIFDTLFHAMGYAFARERLAEGTPDFLFPNAAHFVTYPTDCIVFTCKRTLRERWRQITTEGSRGSTLFLGTLDATVKEADLGAMKVQKVSVVVPESIRASAYPTDMHVISLESFFMDHLDPAMIRWKRNGVIS